MLGRKPLGEEQPVESREPPGEEQPVESGEAFRRGTAGGKQGSLPERNSRWKAGELSGEEQPVESRGAFRRGIAKGGTAMREQLQALIEQKICEWQRDGICESIYAISLYVFEQEEDPRRPVAVLGYNTEQQAERSISQAENAREARWNYAFWLQNQELCWGMGDTAEAVRQWIVGQDLESREEEIAGAFREVLIEVVREIHARGLLRDKLGREVPILIHGLEYDRETARQNMEANGEALLADFPAFCMGEKKKAPDIPAGFERGEKRADMRFGLAFILILLPVMCMLGICCLFCMEPGAIPDMGRNGQESMRTYEGGEETESAGPMGGEGTGSAGPVGEEGTESMVPERETGSAGEEETGSAVSESKSPESDSSAGSGTAVNSASTGEQDVAAVTAESGEELSMEWQVFIHPDVPQPLAEVLEQYELAMNMGIDGKDLRDGTFRDKLKEAGVTGPCYIYDELYGAWLGGMGSDSTVCYSLRDLTGDGVPELIMGTGNPESVYMWAIYEYTSAGEIREESASAYYDMTLYEGGILEYVSGGIDYTITYVQYSQEEQDWQVVEVLGAKWDNDNARDVEPYRQIATDGEAGKNEVCPEGESRENGRSFEGKSGENDRSFEGESGEEEMISGGEDAVKEWISVEEFERIKAQYTQEKMELVWYSLTSPGWHIPVASNALYDVYLEGITTDLWLDEQDVRQLYFTIYDREGELVQELVETSPWLPYEPSAYSEGNFYFEDMNFDGIQDLMLIWVNINHPQWMAYLWREEEGIFREEPEAEEAEADSWASESTFGYYYIEKEQEYIDETAPEGSGYTIYRRRYDRERGYYCVGALFVYFVDETGMPEEESEEEERFIEYFYEDGIYKGCTEDIPWEEVSGIWSDPEE